MKPHQWFVLGAWLAALGVLNGAFAAHGLKSKLPEIYQQLPEDAIPDGDLEALLAKRFADYDTGVRYQMYHALGMMLLGLVANRRPSWLWTVAGFAFFAGIILFSGLLYALVLTNHTYLGAVVPIGGISFIVGWIAVALGAKNAFRASEPGVS